MNLDNSLVIDCERPVKAVALYNIMGQRVYMSRGSDISVIHPGALVPGIYLIQMEEEYTSFSTKIIKR